MRILICSILLTLVSASVSDPRISYGEANPSPESQESAATIHIYRNKHVYGSALEKSVFLDGVEIARIDSGRFVTLRVDAGKHRVHMADVKLGIDVEMKAGGEYYFRLYLAQGLFGAHGRLVAVDSKEGAEEMRKLKPVDEGDIKDKSKVVMTP